MIGQSFLAIGVRGVYFMVETVWEVVMRLSAL